ncbi:MAG TPA: UdgX family uracil-DNA binding protein [Stellaceae bacterium]|jgi:DNA polymerase|nr:UdgX family uracil-DNA binding protein [Stellaceae bacterium]
MVQVEEHTAADLIPPRPSLNGLRRRAATCTACPLYADATQTVFGEGPADARLMLVGEVPGDYEDRTGHPFVGPAGRLLDRCLADAGIDRDKAYVTNVVKHFKWLLRGKKRLHGKINRGEIKACTPWLFAELDVLKPDLVVCLGATAAHTLIGPHFSVMRERGKLVSSTVAPRIVATVHPSALLRGDPATRDVEIGRFVKDLETAARLMQR